MPPRCAVSPATALASAADPGVWDLREGCILVREAKMENGKAVADPTAFTAVTVKHSGAEDAFASPANGAAEAYLVAAAGEFFGLNGTKAPKLPAPVELTFDPSGAKAAVGGNNTREPKNKGDYVKALAARPEYAGKESELKKKSAGDLKKLWEAKPKTGDAPAASEASSDAEESATGDEDAGS